VSELSDERIPKRSRTGGGPKEAPTVASRSLNCPLAWMDGWRDACIRWIWRNALECHEQSTTSYCAPKAAVLSTGEKKGDTERKSDRGRDR